MKDLDYYMSLNYEMKLEELSEDDGGGIFLSIPLLGEMAVNGHGDTYLEAREALENCKKDFFEMWLKEGYEIPEPESEKSEIYFYILKTLENRQVHLV
ncbi:MAG: hypothetical protein IJM82_03840 [Synergistaceae bacterium]|nr:hypothetical protein [Synergistaceae bacterium]MBQ6738658.1 hypothetical protein [Synergistaceae bacterium]MBQ7068277.1 hypothetical protein [Synergistaceae bacterium]MBR0078890.1 hypothetical protein [Synergistaceae bacterium]MBR0234547.1 hypothetical protein [Synergistaceae bacterium]